MCGQYDQTVSKNVRHSAQKVTAMTNRFLSRVGPFITEISKLDITEAISIGLHEYERIA
jgi:hypothetical protein